MGGGYDEPEPIDEEPIDEPDAPAEPEPIYEEYDMADQATTWNQVVEQANAQNLKRIVDEWAELSHNKASQQASLQDKINQLFLQQVINSQELTDALARNNAVVTARINSNGVVLDNLALGGKLSSTDVTSAKLADGFKDTADKAIQAATAASVTTSAPAQGSTGTAQAGLQTVGAVAGEAIMAQMTKLAEAVSLLTLKVAALEVQPNLAA